MKTFLSGPQKKNVKLAAAAYKKGRLGENRTDEEIAAAALVGADLIEVMREFGSRFSLVTEELTHYWMECDKANTVRRARD